MSNNYTFTVFIPTYNRAHTLTRALESIQVQTFRDAEILIIDDGSNDGTKELIEDWIRKLDFPVRYLWQPNQGKHIAHNTALRYIRGKLTVILDSDDMLAPDALERFRHHWDMIPKSERDRYAGIEGLCAHMNDGRLAGTRFPEDVFDSNYIETRKKYKVVGDKKNAIRTDLLRLFPFPQFPGEKHVRPSLLWKRLSRNHMFRYINEVIQYIEYQAEGLSADRFPLRVHNPFGFRFYFMEETNLNWRHYGFPDRFKNCSRFVRYSLHAGIGLRQQLKDINRPLIWLLVLPTGYTAWFRDRIRMCHREKRQVASDDHGRN